MAVRFGRRTAWRSNLADEPKDLVLRMLREVRDTVKRLETDKVEIRQRLDELHETPYTTAGLSMHANVKQDTFTTRMARPQKRIITLEEKA